MGYQTELTSERKDYGANIIAEDRKNKIIIQVKMYEEGYNVGISEVQRILGAMNYFMAKKCFLITTSDFTVPAKEVAKGQPIEFWNREKLDEVIRKYY